MQYNVINSEEDLIEIISSRILEQGENAKDCLVIFPGKRPTFFLRKSLARKKGNAMRSPAIFSMDGFIADLYAKNAAPRMTASQSDIIAILVRLLKSGFCRSISSKDPGGADALLPLAISLSEELEEIKRELIRPEDLSPYNVLLQEEINKAFSYNSSSSEHIYERLNDFSALYKAFYEELDSEGLITPAGKAAWAADFLSAERLAGYSKIFAAGFLRLSKSENRIFRILEQCEAEFLLEDNPLLHKYFPFSKPMRPENSMPKGKISMFRAADAHGEVYKLAEILAGKDKDLDETTAIVLPDPQTLFPLILNAVPEDCRMNVSIQCPITVSPVYSLYMALSGLFASRQEKNYSVSSYIRFITHPYIKNLSLNGESANGRIAAQAFEAAMSKEMRRVFDPAVPVQLGSMSISTEDAIRHLSEIYSVYVRPFEEIDNIADFCCKIGKVFRHAAKNGTAALHAYWTEFSDALFGIIEDIKNSCLDKEILTDTNAYFRFLGIILKKIAYPFQGTPVRGLQILGPLEMRCIKFKKVFFLDANEDVLPASGKKTHVISDFLRRRLGLITHAEREEESRFHFENLIHKADEISIFYCDSSEKEKSPFVEKLIWLKEQQGIQAQSEAAFFTPSFLTKEPSPVRKNPQIMQRLSRFKFSPTSIDTYLKCGLLFFYSYLLRIKEKETVSDSLEKNKIGILVHLILERFFSEKTGRMLEIDYASDYSRICGITEDVLNEKFGSTDTGFEFMFKRQLFRRCSGIISYHKKLADEGTEILRLESVLGMDILTRYGNIMLEGRADRIERRGNTVFVVDYKTNANEKVPDLQKFSLSDRQDWDKTIKSVQLPFYLLACSNSYPDPKNASLMILGLENIREAFLFKADDKKNPICDEGAKTVRDDLFQAIRNLVEEILDPDIPFIPAGDKKRCQSCPFATVCGRI